MEIEIAQSIPDLSRLPQLRVADGVQVACRVIVMPSPSGGWRGCDLDCQLEARLFNKPLERQANELRLAVAEGTRKLCGSPEAKGFPPFLDIAEMGSGDTQLTGEFGLGRFFTEADREQEITQGQRWNPLWEGPPGRDRRVLSSPLQSRRPKAPPTLQQNVSLSDHDQPFAISH